MKHIAANRLQHLRRPVSVLFRLMMAAVVIFAFLSSASAQTAVTPAGSGTEADPYRITVVGNLVWMGDTVTSLSGKYYKMMNDLDASETAKWDGGKGFVPIGSETAPFEGTFDGNNKKITGLTINRPDTDFIGLFGNTYGSTVKNLGLEDFTIAGRKRCGGFVGYQSDGSISNCYSSGSISATDENCGGLVGKQWDGSISNSYSSGSVSATGSYCGGLVGYQEGGSISNCFSTGSVSGVHFCGGLVGDQKRGSISNCYSSGSVSGTTDCGGLVGDAYYGSIRNCYYDRETGGQSDTDKGTPKTTAEMKQQGTFSGWDFADVWKIVEGTSYPYLRVFDREDCDLTLSVIGQGTIVPEAGVTAHSYGAVVSLSAVAADNCVFLEWIGGSVADPTSSNTTVLMDSSKSVTAHFRKTYEIRTLSELQAVNDDLDGHYILMNDIDASETATWNSGKGFVPIGSDATPFEGPFDGNNKKITGLTINRPDKDHIGLFGWTKNSTIKNLGLENLTIVGHNDCGGLVGYANFGSISNCYSTGSVSGRRLCGGLVGYANSGSISNCYSSGSVSCAAWCGGLVGEQWNGSINNCYSSGRVTGGSSCGGLVGHQSSGSTISNCYSSGRVTGGSSCGGLVGYRSFGTVKDSYYDTETSGQSDTGKGTPKTTRGGLFGYRNYSETVKYSYYDRETGGQSDTGKGTPKTTAEMKQRATFSGWDFESIWGIKEKGTYPYLLGLTPRQP